MEIRLIQANIDLWFLSLTQDPFIIWKRNIVLSMNETSSAQRTSEFSRLTNVQTEHIILFIVHRDLQ
jgi:hypothetical protein